MTTSVPDSSPTEPNLAQRLTGRFSQLAFGSAGLLKTGMNWRTCGLAVVTTMSLYFVLNLFLISNVRSTYKSVKLNEVVASADAAESVERLVRAGLLDPKLQPWAKEHLSDRPGRRPAHEQIQDLFDGVASTTEEGKARRAKILEDVATGQMSGVTSRFFWVSSTCPTGAELFEQLAEADGKAWRRALDRGELAEEKKRFIIAYLNAFLAKMQPPLREVNRFNGAVKWLATFAAFLILWAVVGRIYLLARLQSYWLGASPAATRGVWAKLRDWFLGHLPPPEPEEQAELLAIRNQLRHQIDPDQVDFLVRMRMKKARQAIESSIYATYSYAVGLLPSLGFIGTVWGLGGALLQANGLFSVADRQKTIGYITHELGIAFDTTLIALSASVLTGICIAALRLRERWLLDQIQLEMLRPHKVVPKSIPAGRNGIPATTLKEVVG